MLGTRTVGDGTGSAGWGTDAVGTVGVGNRGTVTVGTVTVGTETVGTVTLGTVTVGTVTVPTVTAGTDTVGVEIDRIVNACPWRGARASRMSARRTAPITTRPIARKRPPARFPSRVRTSLRPPLMIGSNVPIPRESESR